MVDPALAHKGASPYPAGPADAHRLPTGPRGMGRLSFCATPSRPTGLKSRCWNGQCSTRLAGLGPRGPPRRQPRRGALSSPAVWMSGSPARQR